MSKKHHPAQGRPAVGHPVDPTPPNPSLPNPVQETNEPVPPLNPPNTAPVPITITPIPEDMSSVRQSPMSQGVWPAQTEVPAEVPAAQRQSPLGHFPAQTEVPTPKKTEE